jgi:hypothetical protein
MAAGQPATREETPEHSMRMRGYPGEIAKFESRSSSSKAIPRSIEVLDLSRDFWLGFGS